MTPRKLPLSVIADICAVTCLRASYFRNISSSECHLVGPAEQVGNRKRPEGLPPGRLASLPDIAHGRPQRHQGGQAANCSKVRGDVGPSVRTALLVFPPCPSGVAFVAHSFGGSAGKSRSPFAITGLSGWLFALAFPIAFRNCVSGASETSQQNVAIDNRQ